MYVHPTPSAFYPRINQIFTACPPSSPLTYIQDCIYRIKESFNCEFDEVLRLKQAEIARVQERNVRIRTIISQLKLDDPLVQPSLDSDEQPDKLLTVQVRYFFITGPCCIKRP